MRAVVLAIVLAALGVPGTPAFAQEFNLVIRNHKFEPEEIRVPAGKRVSIYVSNEDATPEDIEEMAAIVEEAVRAGAVGFSTSRTILHRAKDGQLAAGTTATRDELVAIGHALGAAGHGVFEPSRPPAGEARSRSPHLSLQRRLLFQEE